MNDQPQQAESVEQRLSAFLGAVPEATEETTPQQTQPEAQEEPTEPVEGQSEEEAPPEEEAAPELAEVEIDGKTYQVQPELKDAFMMKADYTRKTQEVAAVRKALETEKAALMAAQDFQKQTGELQKQLDQLVAYKDRAKTIDWSALTLDQKVDLDRELRTIDSQISDIKGQIDGKKQEHSSKFNEFVVQAVRQTEQYMANKVPGWNDKLGKALHEYGEHLGIPQEKLVAGWFADPVATHVMWKAQQWDQLQSSKPQVQNKAKVAPPVIKPGSNAVQKSVVQSEYHKARQQLRKTGDWQDAARLFELGAK